MPLQRTTYGKILADNFDDNILDSAWSYEEGVASNSLAEQNQRLEFIHALNSYGHVQRTFGGINNPVLIAKLNYVTDLLETDWGLALGIWFNQYDYAAIKMKRYTGPSNRFAAVRDADGTISSTETGNVFALNTWYYVKIYFYGNEVYFRYSLDGRNWTSITYVARPATWTIDANSLVILGHGHEQNAGAYPNPDWDNNGTTGSNLNTYIDDFKMVRGETVTVNGLPDGWYFKLYDDSTLIGISESSSGGTTNLSISAFEDLMPFDKIEIYNISNQLEETSIWTEDIWGGDIYTWTAPPMVFATMPSAAPAAASLSQIVTDQLLRQIDQKLKHRHDSREGCRSINTDMQIASRVRTLPPFKVASRTMVRNLNAEFLQGKTVEQIAEKEASYIIGIDGSIIYAINGKTGAIDYSGSDATTVIQNAIDALTSGGTVFVKKGSYGSVSITLKDKIHLIIDKNATTIAATVAAGASSILENRESGDYWIYLLGKMIYQTRNRTADTYRQIVAYLGNAWIDDIVGGSYGQRGFESPNGQRWWGSFCSNDFQGLIWEFWADGNIAAGDAVKPSDKEAPDLWKTFCTKASVGDKGILGTCVNAALNDGKAFILFSGFAKLKASGSIALGDELETDGGNLVKKRTTGELLGYALRTKANQEDLWVFVSKSPSAQGGGDMLKSVYDIDNDGVVDNSELLEGSTKAEIVAEAQAGWENVVCYPFGGTVVLDSDPDETYTAEVSEALGVYTEVAWFDFDLPSGSIKSIFAQLVWAMKITGAGTGFVKWRTASGSHLSPGTYVDITDEVQSTSSSYEGKARSGIIHMITGMTTTTPFTIQCLVKRGTATSAEAKVESKTYLRVTYKVG